MYKYELRHIRISREKKKTPKEINTQKINRSIYDYCSLDFKRAFALWILSALLLRQCTQCIVNTHTHTHSTATAYETALGAQYIMAIIARITPHKLKDYTL